MEGFNSIIDIFKYNILIQKINENDYYGLFIIALGFIMYSFYNTFYFNYTDLYILYYRYYHRNFGYKYSLTLDGQYITKHTSYHVRIRTLMSDNFKALWKYILNNEKLNIYRLLECFDENCDDYEKDDKDKNDNSLFIVDQEIPFELDKNIYCIIDIFRKGADDEGNNNTNNNNIKVTTKHISLTLFSFVYNTSYLKQYIEKIKEDYLKLIEDKRKYLQFYYKLKNIDTCEREIIWYEKEFHTNKVFNKLYIKNKDKILNKINFFLNNEQWYIDNGHPYTLGIGLHGPPGTGKTSFIKCLAKMTERHIIEISLNKIKNENDLYDVYYDNKYHKYNKEAIDFKKKIIIFEDIDCMSDIVLKREFRNQNDELKTFNNIVNTLINNDVDIKLDKDKKKDMIHDNDNDNDNDFKKCSIGPNKLVTNDSITLSSLLNIMDGISEDNGRILIMTSNHWNKLDPALVRPGRIDIEIEMGNIDEKILTEYIFEHYNKRISKNKYNRINFDNITPCIMINEHINSQSLDEYINKLYTY